MVVPNNLERVEICSVGRKRATMRCRLNICVGYAGRPDGMDIRMLRCDAVACDAIAYGGESVC